MLAFICTFDLSVQIFDWGFFFDTVGMQSMVQWEDLTSGNWLTIWKQVLSSEDRLCSQLHHVIVHTRYMYIGWTAANCKKICRMFGKPGETFEIIPFQSSIVYTFTGKSKIVQLPARKFQYRSFCTHIVHARNDNWNNGYIRHGCPKKMWLRYCYYRKKTTPLPKSSPRRSNDVTST